jgi:hypothetical protein
MRLDMSDEDYVVLPPISNINIYAIVVVQMVHWVCKNRQNRKVNIVTGTNSRTPQVNSIYFPTVHHSESFELKVNDLRKYSEGTHVEKDHPHFLENDHPFVVKDPTAMKEDPSVVKHEQQVWKEDPLILKVGRLVVKDDPLVVNEDQTMNYDTLVVKGYPSSVEDYPLVVNEDQPARKDYFNDVNKNIQSRNEAKQYKNKVVRVIPQIMIEELRVVKDEPSNVTVEQIPSDTNNEQLVVKDDPPVVNAIMILVFVLIFIFFYIVYFGIGFDNRWVIQWLRELITFILLLAWFYSSNKIVNYAQRKFSTFFN